MSSSTMNTVGGGSARSKRGIDGFEEGRVAERLEKARRRALCEQPRTDGRIAVGSDEDDWNLPAAQQQFVLEIGTGHPPRHGDVQDEEIGRASCRERVWGTGGAG